MDTHKNAPLTPKGREAMVRFVIDGGQTKAAAARQFKTLTKLLKRARLVGALQQPGPYTVFAPTDAAFKKVPKRKLNLLLRNKAKLKAVLLYHVVPGKVTAADVVKLSSAKTLNGKSVRIRVSGMNVFVNSAKVTTPDVMASNEPGGKGGSSTLPHT